MYPIKTRKLARIEIMSEDLISSSKSRIDSLLASMGDGWRLPTAVEVGYFYELSVLGKREGLKMRSVMPRSFINMDPEKNPKGSNYYLTSDEVTRGVPPNKSRYVFGAFDPRSFDGVSDRFITIDTLINTYYRIRLVRDII